MAQRRTNNINIPNGLLDQVDKIVENSDFLFLNRAQYCTNAIRVQVSKDLEKCTNYQPLESGEERGDRHEQMAERTSTQPDSKGLDNAQGKPHRAIETRVEDSTGKTEKIKSMSGEDDSTS